LSKHVDDFFLGSVGSELSGKFGAAVFAPRQQPDGALP
jgi:hypothetical protein